MPPPKLDDAIGLPFPTLLVSGPTESVSIEEQVLELFDECSPGLRRYVASFNIGAAATEDVIDTFHRQ